MKKIAWLLFSILFYNTPSFSQTELFNDPVFSIGFFNHSIGVPFKDISKLPFNVGIVAGVEFGYGDNPLPNNVQRFEIAYYNHKHLHQSIWIKTDYIRRFIHKSGFYGELQSGLGYIHEFNNYRTFELDSNGQYQSKKDFGSSGFIFSMGFGTGYRFDIQDEMTFIPFVRYEGMIQIPYAKIVPFLPHSMLHLGTKFQLK